MKNPKQVDLDDKYSLTEGGVYITGVQALARLALDQYRKDQQKGLNTAGFISGYRGSPLGGLDMAIWNMQKLFDAYPIEFQPGVNEEAAATAVWGTQQLEMVPRPKYDGVFALWYGKGPGIDRAGDAIKHGNISGVSKNGGVLLAFGDDHPGKSSSVAHHSEHEVAAYTVPVLYPSSVHEILEFGLYGWEMSRFSGGWVGLKIVNETAEQTAIVDLGKVRSDFIRPLVDVDPSINFTPAGYNVSYDDMRVHRRRLPRVYQFAISNRIDRVAVGEDNARLGIVTAGKSYLDVRQALAKLGIDEYSAAEFGVAVYKVGMIFPLEPEGLKAFAKGKQELLFIEEKKAFMEPQAASMLFNEPTRPVLSGKRDALGNTLFHSDNPLTPEEIAQVIVKRLRANGSVPDALEQRIEEIAALQRNQVRIEELGIKRLPYFCAGCPHNSSTKVPDGSIGFSGIGCHGMALWMDRNTLPPTQMGGEGMNWAGMAPFTQTEHIFQNIGDGTYYHSGLLAIRGAINSGCNITYKILYNDAAAMTGGQPVEGGLSVPQIARELLAEGVKKVVVVASEPEKYPRNTDFGAGVKLYHRDKLSSVQQELRQVPGVTAIIYDQVCAAELRRRRKRKLVEEPEKRVFINPAVCEGCGDCSKQANCVAILPLETTWGRKRAIDQSSCNKDYSCLKGFCPAMVTLEGAQIAKQDGAQFPQSLFDSLPAPVLRDAANIIITGIGGTGVITVGAILAMAAHLDGKGASAFDMTGLSQKGGAVFSHLRITGTIEKEGTPKLGLGEADLILGCDLVAATDKEVLLAVNPGITRGVINRHLVPTADFQTNPDLDFRNKNVIGLLQEVLGKEGAAMIDATQLAMKLLGNTIGANIFLLGYAFQQGLLPVSSVSLNRAFEINGVSVEFNKRAFQLGRLAAHSPDIVEQRAEVQPEAQTLDDLIADRVAFLSRYQNDAYGADFKSFVERVRECENRVQPGSEELTFAAARTLSKLMAYKDEYEVARLYTNDDFKKMLDAQFDGNYKLTYHMSPPLIAPRDKLTGLPQKITLGAWLTPVFKLLAKMKFLRGTALDIFGYTAERKMERRLIVDFKRDVETLLDKLNSNNLPRAVDIVEAYRGIRGFGYVKEANADKLLPSIKTKIELFDRKPPGIINAVVEEEKSAL